MAIYSAFSKCLIPPAPPPPPAANKNWNPGTYIESAETGGGREAQWSTPGNNNVSTRGIVQRLQADTAGKIKGVMLRFSWPELEGNTLGSYTSGMNKIQNYLDQIAAFPGRRLIIFIALKTFGGSTSHSVPLYMRTDPIYADGTAYTGSGNGQYAYGSDNGGTGGYVPNIHVSAVKDRLNALMAEFATRFNNNPYLEGVIFNEISIGQPIGSPANWKDLQNGGAGWVDNMVSSFVYQKTILTNVQICQWINDRQISYTMVPGLRSAGIGLGMPDLCPEEKGFNWRNDLPGTSTTKPGNIQHCQESNGLAMIMGHASLPAMNGQVAGRCQTAGTLQGAHVYPAYPGTMTSRQAIFDFAVNTVGCTHYVVRHMTSSQPTTGTIDAAIPATCAQNPYTAYSNYGGQSYNKITDEWLQNPASVTDINAPRPAGWT